MADQANKTSQKLKKMGLTLLVLAFCGFIVYLIIIWITSNNVTMSGNYPEDVRKLALTCSGDGIDYPYYDFDESLRHEVEVMATFSGEKLANISLTNTLFYADEQSVTKSEALNHASMNISIANNKYELSVFSPTYARLSDRMIGRIYSEGARFDDVVARYYMADGLSADSTIQEFASNYAAQGFTCKY